MYYLSDVLLMLQALGAVSENLSPFLLSVIQLSTDVHQACHVYLLEDGLELWLAVLENSSSMSYDLLQLFRNMPPLLGRFLKSNRSLLLSSRHFMPFVLCLTTSQNFILKTTGEGVIWHMNSVKLQYAVLLPCFLHNYLFQLCFPAGQWDLELPWMSWKDQFLEHVISQIIMGWNISEVIYEHLAFQTHMPVVLDIENMTLYCCHI